MAKLKGFTLGELVLCYHGEILYEAKILSTRELKDEQSGEPAPQYYIHYNGWNKKHDAWVNSEKLLKYTEENIKKMEELQQKFGMIVRGTSKRQPSSSQTRSAAQSSESNLISSPGGELRGTGRASESSEDAPIGEFSISTFASADRPAEISLSLSGTEATADVSGSRAPSSTGSLPELPLLDKSSHSQTPSTTLTATPTTVTLKKKRATTRDSDLSDEQPLKVIKSEDKEKDARQESTPTGTPVPLAAGAIQVSSVRPPFELELPLSIKAWLMDDSDLVARERHLLHVPARLTVSRILEDYVCSKPEHANPDEQQAHLVVTRDIATEISGAIREYFNAALGSFLLYKFERPQYSDILDTMVGVQLTDIYGAIHLFRLFVVLVSLLERTRLPESVQRTAIEHTTDLVKYLSARLEREQSGAPGAVAGSLLISIEDYYAAAPDYLRRAAC